MDTLQEMLKSSLPEEELTKIVIKLTASRDLGVKQGKHPWDYPENKHFVVLDLRRLSQNEIDNLESKYAIYRR